MKKAVIAVSFGTTHRDAYMKAAAAAERDIFAAFPDYEPRRAFTSRMITNILNSRGIRIPYAEEAFEELRDYDEVLAVSTHIINGFEYEKIIKAARQCRGKVRLSRPLLSIGPDYDELIRAAAPMFADKDAQYILMGHGSGHFADSAYAALDHRLKAAGFGNVYVAAVEGYPPFGDVLRRLDASKKAVLMPLMLVAGDHAKNDMAGKWAPALEEMGIRTECILKGLGEYPQIRKLYVKHAVEAAVLFRDGNDV